MGDYIFAAAIFAGGLAYMVMLIAALVLAFGAMTGW
jgi:hypothetical protein